MVTSYRYLQLADIAASQWGMVTTSQARSVDVGPQQLTRMTGSGVLQRLQQGVYRIAGIPADPLADLKAAWLALDPETLAADRLKRPDPIGIVANRSAAVVHKFGNIDAGSSEFIVFTKKRARHPNTRISRRSIDASQWVVIDGLPTTCPTTTIGDLASSETEIDQLAAVVKDAILTGKITFADAATTLRPFALDYGAPLGDGQALTKALLGRAGLTETMTTATRFDDAWLNTHLSAAAALRVGFEALVNVGQAYGSADELFDAVRPALLAAQERP